MLIFDDGIKPRGANSIEWQRNSFLNKATEQAIEADLAKGATKQAFRAIVDLYSERLYWHIRTLVDQHEPADDVLQNTFIKVWQNLARFRGDAQLYTWLYRIATNEALGYLRKEKKNKIFSGPLSDYQQEMAADPYFEGDEAERLLLAALQKLPPKQQAVFKLKYFREMKYQEMAQMLDTSVGALKASYHHASEKIKKFIRQH